VFVQLTLDYAVPHLNTKTVIGLTSSPALNFSATTGANGVVAGADVAYDTAKSALTKWSLGLGYMASDYKVGPFPPALFSLSSVHTPVTLAAHRWAVQQAGRRVGHSMWFVAKLQAGLILADKGDTLKASYCQTLDSSQSVGCEVVRKLNSDSTSFNVGYSKALDTGAMLKMRLASSGMGALSYQFSPAPKTSLTLSGQFDTMNLDKNTKLGMSLDAKA
jgi:voltage-dependent anion channel protein 2